MIAGIYHHVEVVGDISECVLLNLISSGLSSMISSLSPANASGRIDKNPINAFAALKRSTSLREGITNDGAGNAESTCAKLKCQGICGRSLRRLPPQYRMTRARAMWSPRGCNAHLFGPCSRGRHSTGSHPDQRNTAEAAESPRQKLAGKPRVMRAAPGPIKVEDEPH